MDKKYTITALGELLVDFTDNGTSDQGNMLFEANPGGAPCNVLSMMEKLGDSAAFIGKIGDDFLGNMLASKAAAQGIDVSGIIKDRNVGTTLAFVQKLPNGDRDFAFFRNPGADMMITADEVSERAIYIRESDIFHFGTLSMTSKCAREATTKAIEIAKKSGCIISFDPNYRAPLWKSKDEAIEAIRYGLSVCDILKISDNEIQFLTGSEDYDEGIRKLRDRYEISLICLTMGKDGSRAYYKDLRVEVPGFEQREIVDATGAGDTFCGSVLGFICDNGLEDLTEPQLREMLTAANAAASLVTQKKGAIRSTPDPEEIRKVCHIRDL